MDVRELVGLDGLQDAREWWVDARAKWRANAEQRKAALREAQAAENAVNPRCVCWHRMNVHGPERGCMGRNTHPLSMYHTVPCPCMRFIAVPKEKHAE